MARASDTESVSGLSASLSFPLRVELTILDDKLYRESIKFYSSPTPHLLYATPYKDAVSPPFPDAGKSGVAVLVGRREQFRQPEVPLLWELEKKRGRPRLAVLTNLRGKEFGPAFRELAGSLAEPNLAPVSFLRRRGKVWDSLDFFSAGDSPSMEGAAPRLKRLKQRGWENLVDRLSMVNESVRQAYFEELFVERDALQDSLVDSFSTGKIGCMIGIAGQCLQKEHLPLFFRETLNARLLAAHHQTFGPIERDEHWTFLAKRDSAKELLLLSPGEQTLKKGDVLVGSTPDEERPSELLVEEVAQSLKVNVGQAIHTAVRVAVEWRYRPVREIPVFWKQNCNFPAGATNSDG